MPFDIEELAGEIINIGARLAERSDVSLGRDVAFVGAPGPSGTTAILAHLANAVVSDSEEPLLCCVIDLDLQSGNLVDHLGIDGS